jgi:hypothetical protein
MYNFSYFSTEKIILVECLETRVLKELKDELFEIAGP